MAIEPLADRFGRRPEELWIVPTWVLGTFPLHAAGPAERAPTRDLLEETTVHYLPAGRLLRTGPAPARLLPGWRYSPHPLLPTTPRRC